jgi:hypothetical protein
VGERPDQRQHQDQPKSRPEARARR